MHARIQLKGRINGVWSEGELHTISLEGHHETLAIVLDKSNQLCTPESVSLVSLDDQNEEDHHTILLAAIRSGYCVCAEATTR